MKIVSLTPSATEIIASLDLLENLVGCSHECNFPEEVKEKYTLYKRIKELTNEVNMLTKKIKKSEKNCLQS